jgi:hypothetical protein
MAAGSIPTHSFIGIKVSGMFMVLSMNILIKEKLKTICISPTKVYK